MLLPHPAIEASREVLLVEGEPDMVAARSHNLPAIAVLGVECWRAEWAPLFAGRRVTIVMDADARGRALGAQIAFDLGGYAEVTAVDVAPDRSDGYDITDLLRDAGLARVRGLMNPDSRSIPRLGRLDEAR
jgi:DNA primase